MKKVIQKENGIQNERIRALEVSTKDLKERFDKFVSNDFYHLRARIDWLTGLIVISILIPILLYLLKK